MSESMNDQNLAARLPPRAPSHEASRSPNHNTAGGGSRRESSKTILARGVSCVSICIFVKVEHDGIILHLIAPLHTFDVLFS